MAKQSNKYKSFKGKILSSVFKGATKHNKDFSKGHLNNFTNNALKATYKQNKMAILNIEKGYEQQRNQEIIAGYKPTSMYWIEKARLKILKRVNASKRNYARKSRR